MYSRVTLNALAIGLHLPGAKTTRMFRFVMPGLCSKWGLQLQKKWSPAPNSVTSYVVDDFCYSYPIIYLPQALPFWSFPVNSVFYPQSHTISAVHSSSCYIGQMMGGGGGEDQRTMTCSAGLAYTRPLGLKKHWTMTQTTLVFCIGNKAGIGSVNLVVGSQIFSGLSPMSLQGKIRVQDQSYRRARGLGNFTAIHIERIPKGKKLSSKLSL